MKINDLRFGLEATAKLLGHAHSQTIGSKLRQFSDALLPPKPTKTSEAVDRILAKWSACSRRQAYPAPLRDALMKLSATQAAFGAAAAAADLTYLLRLFEGSPDQSTSEFCQDVADGLINPAKQAAPKKARNAAPKATPVSSPELNTIADQLVALCENHEAFDQLVGQLASDKRMTKLVVVGIANRFLGYETKFKTKVAALEAIRRRQMQDSIQGARAREVQKIAV